MPPDDAQRARSAAATLRALAVRAAAGDDDAFEGLHARLDAGLLRWLTRRCGGREELAHDLAHRTWVEVWRCLRAEKYDAERAAFSTFLYAVAYKVWQRHGRDSARAATGLDELAAAIADDDPTLHDTLADAELVDAIRACLAATSPPFALTLDEREVAFGLASGETERSLADKLGLAPSTVHARKLSAHAKLRRCLRAKGFSEGNIERGGPGRE
ncbi:MAG: RNA polymerase sigma factor [Phycisphaerae bacterium]